MTSSQIKKFASFRAALEKEKAEVQLRLAEINEALGIASTVPTPAPKPTGRGRAATKRKATRKQRAKNSTSLKEVVLQMLKGRQLTRQEVLGAVQDAGYKFATKDPLNSLSAMLYSNKKEIKKVGKKFTAAK